MMQPTILYGALTATSLLTLLLGIRLFLVWDDLRRIRKELEKTREESYNRNLRVNVSDREVEKLAAQINKNLDYQKELKRETERSRRQLEQSISDIAHDLRTPLTVVKGNLQMLETENLSEQGRDYLKVSSKKAEILKQMVDEFFELSVLESDSKPVELRGLDLIEFLSEFIIENETLIRQHELTPEILFPEKGITVLANRECLTRVFSNLMGNVLKYAKEGFLLQVTREASLCRIRMGNRVEDPDAIDVEHIFDRTYRADKARSDGSAGLGLYIARLLVTKQKGSISAVLEDGRLFFDVMLQIERPMA
ncbi:MAG: HAMP domain-containing histidine kinase [Lachnospiraceae bacterium]|nr:HAMP domain-containing histidine kinase [Lachnospiraceae bacterium]